MGFLLLLLIILQQLTMGNCDSCSSSSCPSPSCGCSPSCRCCRSTRSSRSARSSRSSRSARSSRSQSSTESSHLCPTIISRGEWGARQPKSITPMKLPVNYVIIHHSAMKECSATVQCINEVKSIQNVHMDVHGWDDIGYTFLVGGDGKIYEGRGWNRSGTHAEDYNDTSIGICIIGNFIGHLPTKEQLTATKSLIACGVFHGFINSDYILYGHRDVKKQETSCPGDKLYDEISTWSHKRSTR